MTDVLAKVGRGYAEPAYGLALSEFGDVLRLDASGGQLLRRVVPGTPVADAAGIYPLLVCLDWSALTQDLAVLDHDLASVVAVVDPFAPTRQESLKESFPSLLRPYKEHFVTDLSVPLAAAVSRDHRKKARRAFRSVDTQLVEQPPEHAQTWCSLYGKLVERHAITGMQAFSELSLRRQLDVPGIQLWLASADGEVIAGQLWLVTEHVAYAHLAATTQKGYALRAPYALHAAALTYYRERVEWLHLGAEPDGARGEGLRQFKRGWATGRRTAWLGGRIGQPDVYQSLTETATADRGAVSPGYFPAYRSQ